MVKEKEKRSKREKEIGGTISLFIYKNFFYLQVKAKKK
jgi:hypothetical protein